VEAVRVPMPEGELGPAARLREVWERYRRPVAITEAHHGCTRDEQLRWLVEVWKAADTVRAEGADIRAATIWSLFGTVDWNSLLTERAGIYEAGPFDVRGPEPRPTALAHAAAALAGQGSYDHPTLDRPGWWKRPTRFYREAHRKNAIRSTAAPRRLLIAGATGALGQALSRLCDHRALDHVLLSRDALDIADERSVSAALARHRPWAVVNAAGFSRAEEAEREPERCFRENAVGAEMLAKACAEAGIPLVTFSSDLVFDGRGDRPYVENDQATPAGVLGASKVEAERRVLAAHPGALVVRSGPLFGPWDDRNFLFTALRALADGDEVEAGVDVVSPTYGPDLAHVSLDLLIDGAAGLWHLPNPGALSWAEFARGAAVRAGFDPGRVRAAGDGPALSTALTSGRGLLLPPLESAIDRFLRDGEADWAAGSRGLREAAE
jgi:dTDP-4-dehydrorhamnose reductase